MKHAFTRGQSVVAFVRNPGPWYLSEKKRVRTAIQEYLKARSAKSETDSLKGAVGEIMRLLGWEYVLPPRRSLLRNWVNLYLSAELERRASRKSKEMTNEKSI